MASRPELIEMCRELGIDYEDMTREEMKMAIRNVVDKRFKSKKIRHSASNLSAILRKFLTLEYDYVIKDKGGKKLDYNLKKKGE